MEVRMDIFKKCTKNILTGGTIFLILFFEEGRRIGVIFSYFHLENYLDMLQIRSFIYIIFIFKILIRYFTIT